VAASLARTTRPPVAEELFVNGAHPATAQFEIGDVNLGEETALGLDIGLRRLEGFVTGEINFFAYDFGDYIYLEPTGMVDVDSGFGIFQFRQADARYVGAEAHVDFALLHSDPHHLQLELGGDVVRAELEAGDTPLPQITPPRAMIGLAYRGPKLWSEVAARHTSRQTRVAPFETSTPGFTTYEASAGYRLFGHGLVHDLMLRASNITDRLGRNHISPLKDVAPLPGADVRAIYRLTF
jgi:iron complex outermembrane receptor protein